jgi:hypothetical protein
VNDFVEQCRGEWKRLGVRGAVADEMAAELTADLDEGASPEEVLGSDASDPGSFAAAWARERGVIPRRRRNPRVIVPVVAATLVLATLAGAVLMLTASSPGKAYLDVLPGPVDTPQGFRVTRSPHVTTRAETQRPTNCFDGVDFSPTPCLPVLPTRPSPEEISIENSGVDWPRIGLGLTLFGGIALAVLASAWLWNRARRPHYAAIS